ncbi:MAG: carotenoid 1,2-hydratase [Planctomycetota bacterium]|nr:carotenoid 1,2-hydratase [Planctomycetota bacterium]
MFLAFFLLISGSVTGEPFAYQLALPGHTFEFPQDHRSHDDFRTEWWYFTGHLGSEDRRFGYELTFFRMGLRDKVSADNPSKWTVKDLYFGHFALTDIAQQRFHYFERRGRSGVGTAGIIQEPLKIWIGNWQMNGRFPADESSLKHEFVLRASGKDIEIELELVALKPPVIQGQDGVSQKSEGRGQASHYYSLTRLETKGKLVTSGKHLEVKGTSWMDHEYGSNQMSREQVGWDWFSLQFDDDTELMLYRMRRKDGRADLFSSGTFVKADGSKTHLGHKDFVIESTGEWVSPHSKGTYPSGWKLKVKSLELEISVKPVLKDQELITRESTQTTYWEGAVSVDVKKKGKGIKGQGYVELTGYAGELGGKF